MTALDPREELTTFIPDLRAFARGLCRNTATADDLVQDTMVKAWTNIEKFEAGSNMRAWLFTILRNTYYSLYRRRRFEVADPDGTYVGMMSEKPRHDGCLQLRDFKKVFHQLSEDQREVLILLGGVGLSYEEAAETCGVAIGTIKSRASRARTRLAELMGMDDGSAFDMTDAHTLAVVSEYRFAA